MSKKSILPQSPRHSMIYDEDWQFLLDYFQHDPKTRPSPGVAVREIVHKKIMAMKEQINARLSAATPAAPGTQGDQT